MSALRVRAFRREDEPAVIELWRACDLKVDDVVSMGKRLEPDRPEPEQGG
jgi:hypothetical protein